jgi:hypothetical protein
MPSFGTLAPGNGPNQRNKTGKPVVEVEPPSFTSGQQTSPFQNVNAFQQQRQGFGGIPQHTPPPQPAASAASATPSQTTFGGPSGSLVSFGGFQYDSSVVPQLQGLLGAVDGLSLSSGYRDPARNAAVNGVPNSYHLTGRAADFSGSSAAMNAGAAWARAHGATEVLIHNAGSGLHLHVAW